MKIHTTEIRGVSVVTNQPVSDQRGSFSRFFCRNELVSIIGEREVVQINHSRTSMVGAIRGLHYQRPPHAEMKLVRCIRGRVWDVAVDLRAGSPTFLHWHAEELTPDNARMLVIPEGCAHGFQVLEAESELLYLHTAYYTPTAEGGLHHDEPRLGITWPLPVADLSARDRHHPLLNADYSGMSV
jgi:dTDP-4-dehydrorhamnose 3,5-epimerase